MLSIRDFFGLRALSVCQPEGSAGAREASLPPEAVEPQIRAKRRHVTPPAGQLITG